jgi:hypothetical protein
MAHPRCGQLRAMRANEAADPLLGKRVHGLAVCLVVDELDQGARVLDLPSSMD